MSEKNIQLWQGSSVGFTTILLCQGCGFDPWSEHMQESTNESINKWNNKPLSLSLKSINQKNLSKEYPQLSEKAIEILLTFPQEQELLYIL